MNRQAHWERVYASKPSERLGWYKPRLQTSLTWIEDLGLATDAPIIDVGGGASTLVDDLLDLGYRSITVLDISEQALSAVKSRLGKNEERVTWITGDITTAELPDDHYELWHDRAVFHFLTDTDDQRKYRDQLLKALRPGGYVLIGTFAQEAPPTCSGLPVQRYSRERLQDTLGKELELFDHHKELHVTPGGVEQMYLYCRFRRTTI
jgi:SAM-dependent methyltransferase